MSTEANKAIVRRYIEEVLNAGNFDVADEVIASPLASHYYPRTGGDVHWNPEKEKAWGTWARSVFPDVHFTIEDLIGEEDKVVTRFSWRATHQGEFGGVPGTGKPVIATGIYIFRVADGKLVEEWGEFDHAGLMQQLGAEPPAGQTAGYV